MLSAVIHQRHCHRVAYLVLHRRAIGTLQDKIGHRRPLRMSAYTPTRSKITVLALSTLGTVATEQ